MLEETETEAQSTAELTTTQKKPRLFIYLGLLPVLVFFGLVIGLWLFPPTLVIFEPDYLLPAFNSFLFLAAALIAIIAWRSYLLSGSPTVLWLGCGVLTLGTGALVAGWLMASFGPNVNVTIFNVGVLLAAICHLCGVLASLEERAGKDDLQRRRQRVALAYLAVLGVITLLVTLALSGVMPPFFIQAKGPTPIRQYVVEWSIVLLILAAVVMMQRFSRRRSPFLYWYSLALMLVAIAMLAFFLQRGVGSIIGWVGRSSYVCAAIYFLMSVSSARHQARALRIDLSEAMAEFFRPGQYRALFDNLNDSLAIDELLFDDQGQPCDWRILSVNPAYLKATGKSQAEIIGRRLSEIYGIDRAPEPFLSHFAQVVQTGKPEQVEGYFEPLRMHMQISAFPLGGLRFATLVTDITARKQAEEALKGAHIKAVSEKNRLEAMMEALPVGVAILDEHGGNIRSNSMFEQVWGGPRPLPSDVSDYAAYKAWWMDTGEPVQPEEWASAKCVQQRKAVLGQLMKIQRFDGTFAFVMNSGTPILDVAGKVTECAVAILDITKLQQSEEALQSSEERFRKVFENAPTGIAIADWQGRFEQCNPAFCALVGYSEEELRQLDFGSLIHPEDQDTNSGRTILLDSGELPFFELENRYVRKDGQPVWVRKFISVLPSSKGGPMLRLALVTDITARKRAEETLKRQHAILTGINRILQEALICQTEAKLGETCLAVVEELTGSRFGFICEVNQAGRFDTIAISDPGWSACKIPISETKKLLYDVPVCGIRSKVYETGEPLLSNDPSSHPDFIFPPEGHPPITAFLGVPLKHENQTIGLVALGNKEEGYTDTDRETVEALAPVIVEAFMRQRAEQAVQQARDELEKRVEERTEDLRLTVAQLQTEVTERLRAEKAVRESEERLRYLASRILTAQEQERKRIAMELHEGLGQSMTALKLYLRTIQRHLPKEAVSIKEDFDDARNLLSEMIEEVRHISRGLSPTLLENLGLTAALKHLLDEISKVQEIAISTDIDEIQNLFSPQTETNLFRGFQEALNNIAKHAQASQISVTIKRQDSRVNFLIKDNGVGFDLEQITQENSADKGMGLPAMDERLRMIGAHLNIVSQKGRGTEISFSIPYDANSLERNQ